MRFLPKGRNDKAVHLKFILSLPRLKRGALNNELRLYPMNLEQVMLFKEK